MSNKFKSKMLKVIFTKILKLKNFLIKPRSISNEKINKINENSIYNFELKNQSLSFLIDNFHRYGHLNITNKNSFIKSEKKFNIDQLYNFSKIDFDNFLNFLNSNLKSEKNIDEIKKKLSNIFCEGITAEFIHLNKISERRWFIENLINKNDLIKISSIKKKEYLKLICRSEEFDRFLSKKFQSIKRYSGEGAETTLICLYELFECSAVKHNLKHVVISMAHRTRNNVLTVLLNHPPVLFFRKMIGKSEFPHDINCVTGDTFSHYFTSTEWLPSQRNGESLLNISLIPNPSHLEANIPVGAGKVRSKMMWYKEGDYSQQSSGSKNGDNILPIFIHGDASVCGQGIVPETLVMCNSPNFSIGGAIHIVINNHVGFTTNTPPGSSHVTDVAKITNCPIIHVDGFDVVEVARAATLALEFRQTFRKDIFINLICYRRWGHNELDDPTITQPLMYKKINNSKSIVETFLETLKDEKIDNLLEDLTKDLDNWTKKLNEHLTLANDYNPELMTFKKQWSGMKLLDKNVTSLGVYDTGFNIDSLKILGQLSVYLPESFAVHQNVFKSHIRRRIDKLNSSENGNIDWATAEALSIGSLMSEGYNCRISGQDVGRGTFNHRHFSLVDQETNYSIIPFNIAPWPSFVKLKGNLEVANSILSEEAVLGFEIGMALDNPNQLCIWEAQFGDFFNGAQILIDTYLGSAETKWLLQNGLVMLMPHGYDGAGPEHSSCRMERFLQMTDSSEITCDSDSVNIHIINPTTPAQYFHALRRQIIRPFRRPLVVVSPKILLRSPNAVSSFSDIDVGTYFHHILPHSSSKDDKQISSVILCSGKHYYTLKQYIDTELSEDRRQSFAIIRLEQLAPFPASELKNELTRYKNCKRFIWAQEEARNMGAWSFVEARVRNILGVVLDYAGRKESAAPAVGIGELHKKESLDILNAIFV